MSTKANLCLCLRWMRWMRWCALVCAGVRWCALVCAVCGEALFATPADGARYDAAIRAHIAAVNLDSAPDLRAIRKRLKLTQAEAGRIFGGGVTAFSRYERGAVKPPVALVKFFQVLDRHPDLLAELK